MNDDELLAVATKSGIYWPGDTTAYMHPDTMRAFADALMTHAYAEGRKDEREELESLRKDAERWRFLAEHWHSLMGGIPLHRWLDEQALRRGGVTAALDYAMDYHHNSERHIA